MLINRRQLLMALGLTSLPLFKSCGPRRDFVLNEKQKRKKIIILGAGLAGLSCARNLNAYGFDTEILEARSRVGGRVWTHQGIDLGASFLHGGGENPLRTYAHQWKLPTRAINQADVLVHSAKHGRKDLFELRSHWDALYELMEEVSVVPYLAAWAKRHMKLPISVSTVQEIIDKAWAKFPEGELKNADAQAFLQELSNQSFGIETSKLSLLNLLEEPYVDISGHGPFPSGELIAPFGLSSLPERLSEGLKIKFEHMVEHIEKTNQGYLLKGNFEEVKADILILCLPMECLKKGRPKIHFDLPRPWLKAFEGLASSHLNKLALTFERPFWQTAHHSLLYHNEDKRSYFLNYDYHRKDPILLGMKNGAEARRLDESSLEELVSREMSFLKGFYDDSIPDPVDVQISRWGADPLAGAAFSHLSMNARGDEHGAFRQNLRQDLWIAGEFAHPTDPGTMHGAYWSGKWVAQQLLGIDLGAR